MTCTTSAAPSLSSHRRRAPRAAPLAPPHYPPALGPRRRPTPRALSRAALRVALLAQDNVLFSTTIRENITYGLPREARNAITDAQVEDACKKANAWSFINDFPRKLETYCGERGVKLSGGQKQAADGAHPSRPVPTSPPLWTTLSLSGPPSLASASALTARRGRLFAAPRHRARHHPQAQHRPPRRGDRARQGESNPRLAA